MALTLFSNDLHKTHWICTVNHRLLILKLYDFTQDSKVCRVIQYMLSIRRFYVELNNDHSRWRNQKKGLPQGSVLSPVLFNIYTNDQPLHAGTRNFIYADDLCVTAQYPSCTEVEHLDDFLKFNENARRFGLRYKIIQNKTLLYIKRET